MWRDVEDRGRGRKRRYVCVECHAIILYRPNLVETRRNGERVVLCAACAAKEAADGSD